MTQAIKRLPPLLKYTATSFGILALATLVIAVYLARHPQDMSATIYDEMITTANGSVVRWVHPNAPEKGLILFISDYTSPDVTTDYAKKMAVLSYNVVVLQAADLLSPALKSPAQCLDLAAKLLELKDNLNQQFHLDTAQLPILVGINEGASVVYTALAQDTGHDFHAGISINFSGQLHSDAELCAAQDFVEISVDGVMTLSPVEHVSARWYLFQDGTQAQLVDMRDFADQVANARFTLHQRKDQPLIAEVLQILQWLDPRLADQTSAGDAEGNLPLIEVPAAGNTPSHTMAIMLTGDGGWAEIDKGIAAILAEHGIPTVALDSLSYFWKKKTPEEAAADIENIMTVYLGKWQKQQVILIGYSFGADVMPFIANRISATYREHIALIAMLGIGKSAAFEFHLSSWMDDDESADRLPLAPEIRKMDWARSMCIYGEADQDADCAALGKLGVKAVSMSGDHHFDGNYREVVQHILDYINSN